MSNKYYQKHKRKLRKKVKGINIFMNKKKTKGEKRPEENIKILLKKKKKKCVNIIANVMKIFLRNKSRS